MIGQIYEKIVISRHVMTDTCDLQKQRQYYSVSCSGVLVEACCRNVLLVDFPWASERPLHEQNPTVARPFDLMWHSFSYIPRWALVQRPFGRTAKIKFKDSLHWWNLQTGLLISVIKRLNYSFYASIQVFCKPAV